MNLEQYRAYLDLFNARDYDGVLSYFHDDAEILFAGYALHGHQAVRDFYAFFHEHVDETISLSRFLSADDIVVLEATVRLEAKHDLTAEMLAEKGLERIVALKRGNVVEMQQFIHYHMVDGRFSRAICAVLEPVREVVTGL
jgi:hypothetical protein